MQDVEFRVSGLRVQRFKASLINPGFHRVCLGFFGLKNFRVILGFGVQLLRALGLQPGILNPENSARSLGASRATRVE